MFPESEFEILDMETQGDKVDTSKVYKIRYAINMLPSLGFYKRREKDPYTGVQSLVDMNVGVNILQLCAESDEIELFEAESIQDLS